MEFQPSVTAHHHNLNAKSYRGRRKVHYYLKMSSQPTSGNSADAPSLITSHAKYAVGAAKVIHFRSFTHYRVGKHGLRLTSITRKQLEM
jgi:hypothetical protein